MRFTNKALLVAGLFLAVGCQNLRTRDDIRAGRQTHAGAPAAPAPVISGPVENQAPVTSETVEFPPASPEAPPPPPAPLRIPKVGLILGPGGARAWAHIGAIQEIQREKIPVVGVAGIEWGAIVAALYSNKGQPNEAEWQMSKLKSDEIVKRSLIGRGEGPADVRQASEFLRQAFGKARVEDARLPFACPAMNFTKNQVFVMSRGSYDQLMPYCLAYPPVFRPYQANVAGVREVKVLADYLRSRGATTIVLVNVLGNPNPGRPITGNDDTMDGVAWNELAAFYSRPLPGVDHVITIPLGNQSLTSFDDHREIQQRGAERGGPLVRQLAHRLGL